MSDEKDKALESLAEARKLVEELAKATNEFTDEKKAIEEEVREHYRLISSLESKKVDIDRRSYEARLALSRAKRAVEDAEAAAKRVEENDRIRIEFQELTAQFDKELEKYAYYKKAFPHQIEGAKKLAVAKRGILGDKRGLGKSLTSIMWADLVGAKKILAIIPNDVMGNFEREVREWAPHRSVHILGGMTKFQRNLVLDLIKEVHQVMVILNYEAWRKDFSLLQKLIDCQFDTMIIDEAHNIKNPASVAARGIKEIAFADNKCYMCGSNNFGHTTSYPFTLECKSCHFTSDKHGDERSVQNILPMTGTPILNQPQDFFPLLQLVDDEQFHDSRAYLNQYCEQGIDGKWKFQWGGEARLTTRLSSVYVARDRDQAGIKLPPQHKQIYELDLDPAIYPNQYKAYKALTDKAALVVNDLLSEMDDPHATLPVLYTIAMITRERQMMTWPAGIQFKHPRTGQVLYQCDAEESVKIDKCIDRSGEGLIPQFVKDESERVVLFSQFKQPLIELEKRLKKAGISVVRYDGDASRSMAQEIQIDFDRKYQSADKPYKWDVALCHYKKGGVGLNLTAATQTIFLDEEWNPGKEDQAMGRNDRIGQIEETTVHVLRVKDSIDDWLAALIAQKKDMIDGFEIQADLQQQLLDILRGIKPKDPE